MSASIRLQNSPSVIPVKTGIQEKADTQVRPYGEKPARVRGHDDAAVPISYRSAPSSFPNSR